MPKLTIYLPDQEPLKISFDGQPEISIGRADDNDVVAIHDSISSHHAQLRLVGDQYHLVDLDSTNGTFLDGAPTSEAPLGHGSRITFGQVEADYELDEVEEADAGGAEEEVAASSSGGSGFESTIHADIADQSVRPADFKNLSPLPKVEKTDAASKIAMILGVVGLIAALAVAGLAMMMKV